MTNLLSSLLNGLRPTAAEQGLFLDGRVFHREQGCVLATARYQGSLSSSKDRLRFTVNLEVYVLPLLKLSWKKEEPHWAERIGYMLPDQDDIWWIVNELSLNDDVAAHRTLFRNHIGPLLWQVGDMSFLQQAWTTGETGYLSPMVRDELLSRSAAAGLI